MGLLVGHDGVAVADPLQCRSVRFIVRGARTHSDVEASTDGVCVQESGDVVRLQIEGREHSGLPIEPDIDGTRRVREGSNADHIDSKLCERMHSFQCDTTRGLDNDSIGDRGECEADALV